MLAFDSRVMRELFLVGYKSKYPIFYKIKQTVPMIKDGQVIEDEKETRILTAIDIALENNQIRAINDMIDYIIKFQNSFVFQFLFEDNFIKLLEKGIKLAPLLQSEVFYFEFNHDEWPRVSTCGDNILAPFCGSLFHLKYKYQDIFNMIPDE